MFIFYQKSSISCYSTDFQLYKIQSKTFTNEKLRPTFDMLALTFEMLRLTNNLLVFTDKKYTSTSVWLTLTNGLYTPKGGI